MLNYFFSLASYISITLHHPRWTYIFFLCPFLHFNHWPPETISYPCNTFFLFLLTLNILIPPHHSLIRFYLTCTHFLSKVLYHLEPIYTYIQPTWTLCKQLFSEPPCLFKVHTFIPLLKFRIQLISFHLYRITLWFFSQPLTNYPTYHPYNPNFTFF